MTHTTSGPPVFRQLIVEKTTFSSCLCNHAFLLSSLALSRTQTPSSAHFFFRPIDRPTITRDGAMGDEPFYWDGLAGTEMLLITSCAGLYVKYLNLNSLSGQPTLLNLQKATVCWYLWTIKETIISAKDKDSVESDSVQCLTFSLSIVVFLSVRIHN